MNEDKVVKLPGPPPPEFRRLEEELQEFPELQVVRELTIVLNTHAGGQIVENFRAALKRILQQ